MEISLNYKEDELNRILDKINNSQHLTKGEESFLSQVNEIEKIYSFSHLSKEEVYSKIKKILKENIKVICDLHDRDGKLGIPIKKIVRRGDNITIYLENKMRKKIIDKFLYNIEYEGIKNIYLLSEQDEYFEKINI